MPRRGRAFTLIEMLVVLVILAVVTAVALRSGVSLERRTRFESTLRALAEARAALLGASGAGGFLADLGRLPEPPPEPAPDGLMSLSELFHPLPGVRTIRVESPAADPEVAVAVGWRGPYLTPPPTDDPGRVLDGWGHEIRLRVLQQLGGGLLRVALVSAGADGVFAPDAPAGDDLEELLFLAEEGDVKLDELFCDVTVTVTLSAPPPPGAVVTVFAYGPDGLAGGLAEKSAPLDPSGAPVLFADLPRAPWVFRAYLHPDGLDPRADALAKSPPVRRALAPRVDLVDLSLTPPSGPEGGTPGGPPGPLGGGKP